MLWIGVLGGLAGCLCVQEWPLKGVEKSHFSKCYSPQGYIFFHRPLLPLWSTWTHVTHGHYLCLNSCQLWSAHIRAVKWIKLRFPLPPDLSTLICMLITLLPSVSLFYPLLDFLSMVTLIEFLALSSQYREETEARWCRGAGDSGGCLLSPPFHWSKPRWASWLSWMLWMPARDAYCSTHLPFPEPWFSIHIQVVLCMHLCFTHPWTLMIPPVL